MEILYYERPSWCWPLHGYLSLFVNSLLMNRVRVDNTYSDVHRQEMGVPQGNVLSVALFSLKINNIVKCVLPGIQCLLYGDDFVISYASQLLNTAERHVQQCLDFLQHQSDSNGFKFSTTKSVSVHFLRQRRIHLDPTLFHCGSKILVVDETKFFDLIFDKKSSGIIILYMPFLNCSFCLIRKSWLFFVGSLVM